MVFYDDRQYKARDICFFELNWSQKLSSNSIGPENLRSQNRNVDLTRLHDKISTWLHHAGFRLHVASHVSEISSIASCFVLHEAYSNLEQL